MSFQVEGTNDSSCLSKCSMVKQGYFNDDYLVHFVCKKSRRSSLIHIGYYVRATVISSTLKEFYNKINDQVAQVISVGAGFDTSFFRLSKDKHENIIYYEIDLPRVVTRKIECIEKSEILKNLIGKYGVSENGLSSSRYHLIAADVRDLTSVETLLSKAGINFVLPTLFLSECAITYLDECSSDNLIEWGATKFTNATFVTYEQIEPDDGFGIVMLQHFEKINSPLESISSYPTLVDQEERYKKLGWKECRSISAYDAYFSVTTPEEYARAVQLEPFDEWEEFHLKCCHYSLVIASQGSLSNWSLLCKVRVPIDLNAITKTVIWNLIPTKIVQSYGHCLISLDGKNNDHELFIVGGFGRDELRAHRRNKYAFSLKSGNNFTRNYVANRYNCNANEVSFETMYATCALYSSTESCHNIILYGGRTSPTKCVNISPVLVEVSSSSDIKCRTLVTCVNYVPPPRWRHTSVIVKQHGIDTFVVFGGCTESVKVLGDAWKVNLPIDDDSKRKISALKENDIKPCPRFSHSAAVLDSGVDDCGRMLISGGLDTNLKPLCDIWELDMKTEEWNRIDVQGMLPRFGHTSHIVNTTLILVGGVNTLTGQQPAICVVDLCQKRCTEYQYPHISPERPVMLINHSSVLSAEKSSILVIGGGGTCFSFGTFFNSHIVQIDLDQFNIS